MGLDGGNGAAREWSSRLGISAISHSPRSIAGRALPVTDAEFHVSGASGSEQKAALVKSDPLFTFCRAEELINRGVAHPRLLRDMARVAAGLWRCSAFGIHPANKGRLSEDARPLLALGAQEEPLNCA